MMKKNKIINLLRSGVSLPITILFSFICSGFLFSYMLTIHEKDWQVEYRIAQTKALYNAESGIAIGAYPKLFKKEYSHNPATDTLRRVNISGMGEYSVGWHEGEDTVNAQKMRMANSHGYAFVKRGLFKKVEIKREKKLTMGNSGFLSDYLYLTNSESAGGAPWSFDDGNPGENTRREVTFGSQDEMNSEWANTDLCDVKFQSNDNLVMSDFGSPTFNMTVTFTRDEDGNILGPEMGGNNFNSVFQGNPKSDTLDCVNLPPKGYEENKAFIKNSNRHLTLEATQKLKFSTDFENRDTLIMTDIEFFVNPNNQGQGFYVKQWWFLVPPYLKKQNNNDEPATEETGFNPGTALFEIWYNQFTEHDGSNNDCTVGGNGNIQGCSIYDTNLNSIHSKRIQEVLGVAVESFVPPDFWGIVAGPHGFAHYDYPEIYTTIDNGEWTSQFSGKPNRTNNGSIPLPFVDGGDTFVGLSDQLLPEYKTEVNGRKRYSYNHPMAIYVEGGPVRVHGEYKGRYTIYTDEYTTYRRHAHFFDTPGEVPIDTLWNNIFIIDDLVNTDASPHSYQHTSGFQNNPKSMFNKQPNPQEGEEGSENVLGLVSGANILLANTTPNGARDCNGNQNSNHNFCNININAHMVAFNESIATHYSQNTYTNNDNGGDWDNPPYGDGQGNDIFGASGSDDSRGMINIWGGMVQSNRGYVYRNSPGPYSLTGGLGYQSKNYNYDCNVKTNPPPIFPEIERCGNDDLDETPWIVTGYY